MKTNNLFIVVWVLFFITINQKVISSDTNSIVEIRQQIEKLKSENVALKQENQVLRKLVFERQNAYQPQPVSSPTPSSVSTPLPPAPPSTPSAARVVPTKPSSGAVEYWITTSSSKRHNSGCKYFQTSRGRPGAATEGTACKICGG
jgi:hypothetical protein